MIPETTTVAVEDGVLEWTNRDFDVEKREAEAIAEKVRTRMDDPDVRAILVDNTEASGTWPDEIDEVWADLMADIYAAELPCATVSPSTENCFHINRLSRENDTLDRIKAFGPSEHDRAEAFLEL